MVIAELSSLHVELILAAGNFARANSICKQLERNERRHLVMMACTHKSSDIQ